MSGKKIPGRFTIGFNLADPSHQAVSELLEQQGRKKAQFIVNAVLHYIHCPSVQEVPVSGPAGLPENLEALVIDILERKGYLEAGTEKGRLSGPPAQSPLNGPATDAITDTLAAFRGQ